MTAKSNLLVKKFIKIDVWLYAFTLFIVLFTAYVFDKYIEAFCFSVAHYVLRPKFDKQYHNHYTEICLYITSIVAFLGIAFTLPTGVSLISSIPIALFVCWIGNIVQDRIDLKIYKREQNKIIQAQQLKLKEYETPNIYAMSETELRQYCKSKKLSILKEDIVIMRVIEKLSNTEIATIKGYSIDTIDYHVRTIKDKNIPI